ncbi:putative precorrin-2 dehydrogenase/oxidase [Clostridium bornimense]|uniref:precorrin-2 dehydrogenase n=1 Tax=Clostridium bornimense TaxID=1216932 RepID=W6S1V9_9CLOT|nr:NAD(P)-dependent oxidoreductase [Clostridium bornimense]CDM68292.1 putative precorrin-2 dehydrogenase/oxidase [Clostridium bornimense]
MSKNSNEDIHEISNVYNMIGIMSNKIKVGIIGGGKVGFLKARKFINKGSKVEVISKSFYSEFYSIKSNNVILIEDEYKEDFIKDKHIIIIAINNIEDINRIVEDCNKRYKLFINCYNYRNGLAVMTTERETKNLCVSINSKLGNPIGTMMVANSVKGFIEEYDEFIEYTSLIRKRLKNNQRYKDSILTFINTEDFKEIYSIHKDRLVLTLFYGEDIIKALYKKGD